MSVAGIDFSSFAVDVVIVDEDDRYLVDWYRFPLAGVGDAFDRARYVRAAMPGRGWWDDKGVIAVGIEQPFGRGSSVTPLYRVQGGILQCLPRDLLVQPWIPSAWRKAVGLPGNAKKLEVAEHVHQTVGGAPVLFEWPQDACDAYCIARATADAIEIEDAA